MGLQDRSKRQGREDIGISQAAAQLQTTLRTIRFYESKGLISTGRDRMGKRTLSADQVERVKHIFAAQSVGFSLTEITRIMRDQTLTSFRLSPSDYECQRKFLVEQQTAITRKLAALESYYPSQNNLKSHKA